MKNPESDKPILEEQPMPRPKRCWRFFAIFCLFWYALLGWLRFSEALSYQAYLTEMHIWPGAFYIMISGLVIGVGFSLAMVLLMIRAKFTAIYVRLLGILFLAWLWFDHTWLGTRKAFTNQAAVSILITLVTLIIMFVLVRSKDFRKEEAHDKQ